MSGIFVRLAFYVGVFAVLLSKITCEGNIGCLFSDSVCTKEEWCFHDNAFGRCLPYHGQLSRSSFYQYDLQIEMIQKLEDVMERLFEEGYHWNHAYTQCILQNLLYSQRFGFEFRPSLCSDVAGLGQTAADLQQEMMPRDLAVIHFDPKTGLDELSDFASEWFVPPLQHGRKQEVDTYGNAQRYSTSDSPDDNNDVDSKVKRYKENSGEISSKEMMDVLDFLKEPHEDEVEGTLNDRRWRDKQNGRKSEAEELYNQVSPEEFDQLQALFSASAPVQHPREYSADGEEEDATEENYFSEAENPVNTIVNVDSSDESMASTSDGEGGNYWNGGGFKRLHRYDVKKPGPNFMNNLDDFDSTEAVVNEQLQQVSLYKVLEDLIQNKYNQSEMSDQEFTADGMVNSRSIGEEGEKEYEMPLAPTKIQQIDQSENKRKPTQGANGRSITTSLYGVHHKDLPIDSTNEYYILDKSYVTISVDKNFQDKADGDDFVKTLGNMLELPRDTFTNIKVDQNQVTFKVNPNLENINSSSVVLQTESMKNELFDKTGKHVTGASIGNQQVKISGLSLDPDKKLFIVTFVVCGCIAGVLIAVAVLYVIRRHARSKEKLQALAQPETEPSDDYKDLCRQRMANKNNEKPEAIHVAQRAVTSLSRESEASARSSSSRSSTSSWSEEPVTSNMDISTGHMVLSYMEDHLKNKDRLEQEWVALCAYEAEPCNMTAAHATENVKKNRYPDVLPYDHSRVVLNDISNINGSDYINASTITDHDPRNPAYIASQGPLPHTAADFWQMVWEQGSVVLVTLTRLVENGVAMCHRYWPEEGSELYHIYEVHLVSEHIWCDDYLVRSFYLKNLKTGETRTVTQFHFISWPDNSVPVSVKALLDFRRKVNKSYRGRSCPIVVHCSDGSGRTGTYCLIDMVLNRMAKGAKEIDIAATLEHIRDQRPYMVKTKGQFEFALMAVAEEVHAILKALPQ